jgi:hypothetical protein
MGEKRRKGKVVRELEVDLLETARFLSDHLTEDLCREVFQQQRTNERERLWSLYSLGRFWQAIILQTPGSLTQALEEGMRGEGLAWPEVQGTAQAFFARCKSLDWKFFHGLYHRFVDSITPRAIPSYAPEFAGLREKFPEVWAIDGSRLDKVAHRLKILWKTTSAVLPGCVLGLYDLFRGYPRRLQFDPDAARAESKRALEALDHVPPETLLLGDRLYAVAKMFEALTQRGIYGLFRLNNTLSIQVFETRLGKRRVDGGTLEDWIVTAGSGATAPPQRLRYIRYKQGKKVYELLTNVLDPQRLPAWTAIRLYPFRWKIERMFYDLKIVLKLKRFHVANPNGVAMQLFAAAMVYTAMRVAQGRIPQQIDVSPEEISPAKLFPRIAKAITFLSGAEFGYLLACRDHPNASLRKLDLSGHPEFRVPLREILVEHRSPHRRKRRPCKGRTLWKSFAHIPGGKSLT